MPTNAGHVSRGRDGMAISKEEAQNRLAYLADLLLDLQALTGTSGGPTLSGLLALAHAEATLQAKRLHQLDDDGLS